MLLSAYEQGIFPWYSEGEPILWHSPDPRFVIDRKDFRVPKSVKKVLNRGEFAVTFDRAFDRVIRACKEVERAGQSGTWITDEMEEAYVELHRLGYAHSAEVWLRDSSRSNGNDGNEDVLVGGLYGVSLGRVYFGESMFSARSNASKVGFVTLARRLFDEELAFEIIDSQVYTEHVERFGAEEIPRERYLGRLEKALRKPTLRGSWSRYEVSPQ